MERNRDNLSNLFIPIAEKCIYIAAMCLLAWVILCGIKRTPDKAYTFPIYNIEQIQQLLRWK